MRSTRVKKKLSPAYVALVLLALSVLFAAILITVVFGLSTLESARDAQDLINPLGVFVTSAAIGSILGGAPYYLARGKAPWGALWGLSVLALLLLAGIAIAISAAAANAASTLPIGVVAAAPLVTTVIACAIPATEAIVRRREAQSAKRG